MEREEFKNLDLTQYKVLFVVVTAVLALLVASPALQKVLIYPRTEFFTELSLLGPGHMAENYPHNITRNQDYSLFLGIGNQLGSCAYYQVQVKFRNETQSAPDSFNRTHSTLLSLYNMTAFVADQEGLEIPLNFAFDYSFKNVSRIVYTNVTVSRGPGQNDTFELRADHITLLQANFYSLRINDVTLNLQGYSADWNPQTEAFYGNIIFELWKYNSATGNFQYHERFVDLKFNMTTTGMGDIFVG
jgi:hypothetical protein